VFNHALFFKHVTEIQSWARAGLTGSQTTDNSALQIYSSTDYMGSTPFPNSSNWFQNGTMIFRMLNTSLENVSYFFSFKLVNPMIGQQSPDIYVESTSCFIPPYPGELGALIQPPCELIVIGKTLLGSGEGDKAPLMVIFFATHLLYQSTSDQVVSACMFKTIFPV
jgi:hypothetical protein